jgi:nicotinamidase-related amidase
MQKGSFTKETPRFDTNGVVERINALTRLFRVCNLPVIYIQHNGSSENAFVPNTTEWELLDELEVESNDIIIEKYANNVFYQTEFQNKLKEFNIDNLFITGCATDSCIDSTIQSALAKDFTITVVPDGHTTGEQQHLNAEKTIEHYNWIWQSMIPTKGSITVKSFENLKNNLLAG